MKSISCFESFYVCTFISNWKHISNAVSFNNLPLGRNAEEISTCPLWRPLQCFLYRFFGLLLASIVVERNPICALSSPICEHSINSLRPVKEEYNWVAKIDSYILYRKLIEFIVSNILPRFKFRSKLLFTAHVEIHKKIVFDSGKNPRCLIIWALHNYFFNNLSYI